MRQVSDAFLLNMAEVSSALLGLFLVGMFFFADTGFRRLGEGRAAIVSYFRASTRIVLVVFAFPLGLSLALVVLDPVWARILFVVLSLSLIAANVDSALKVRAVTRVTRSPTMLVNEMAATGAAVVIVILPWVLGGFSPSREDLTWAIVLSFAVGVISIGVLVLAVFDLAPVDPDST